MPNKPDKKPNTITFPNVTPFTYRREDYVNVRRSLEDSLRDNHRASNIERRNIYIIIAALTMAERKFDDTE